MIIKYDNFINEGIFRKKKDKEIIDFIYRKLKDIYDSDDVNYRVYKQPNEIWNFYYPIDEDNPLFVMSLLVDSIVLGNPKIEGYIKSVNIIGWEEGEEEWDETDEIKTHKFDFSISLKILNMVKKLYRKKKKIDGEKDIKNFREIIKGII